MVKKPMLVTLSFEEPKGQDWMYEVKYDGFRAILEINKNNVDLISRNMNSLIHQFPEIREQVDELSESLEDLLPLTLDGELCLLDNPYKANFGELQTRGRMSNEENINKSADRRACHFLAFDLLSYQGIDYTKKSYIDRKKKLKELFTSLHLPETVTISPPLIQYIPSTESYSEIWKKVKQFKGEGVIAKRKPSIWETGKRSSNWVKIKNWQTSSFIVTSYDKQNGYFHVGVVKNDQIASVGLFSHGINDQERTALLEVMKANKVKETEHYITVETGICVDLKYLEVYKEQLRQPMFAGFRFDITWHECTWEKVIQQEQIEQVPDLTLTSLDKMLWPDRGIKKEDYITYLENISSYLLPFLKNRLLTVIRYPHGMYGESFYQKNTPTYAPEFVQTKVVSGINYTLCNDVQTLLWLGNQLALEFHIPFQTVLTSKPSEIVFDLDPPSRDYFHLAIHAALLLKEICDNLKLIPFVKTSGNKGLQVYIPLPENEFTYDETRIFTSFIATYLTEKRPDLFTTERLKKNRGQRLYVDYIQHAEGKTIIAPYSPRGKNEANVATPLFWDEVKETLNIDQFHIKSTLERIRQKGDPFAEFLTTKDKQPLRPVLDWLKNR